MYGYNTLDSLRAALKSPATGLTSTTKIGLAGYSGGAIATEWAAQLAPTYAPEINSDIVGAAMGGVLVDPAHNLKYIEGSSTWASVIGKVGPRNTTIFMRHLRVHEMHGCPDGSFGCDECRSRSPALELLLPERRCPDV